MNGNERLVTITSKAASELRDIAAGENRQIVSLRIAAVRTHCMGGRGYTYRLEFEDSPAANDEISEHNGIKVYVDPASAGYLKRGRTRLHRNTRGDRIQDQQPKCPGKVPLRTSRHIRMTTCR